MKKTLPSALFALGFAVLPIFDLADTLVISIQDGQIFLFAVLILFVLTLAVTFKRAFLIVLLAAIAAGAIFWPSGWFDWLLGFCTDYARWAMGELSSLQINGVMVAVSEFLLVLGFAVPMFFLAAGGASVVIFAVAGVAVFFGQQVMGYSISPPLFFLYLFLLLLYAVWRAAPLSGKRGRLLLLSAPVCLALLWAASALPVFPAPLGETLFQPLGRWFSSMYASRPLPDTGFSLFSFSAVSGEGVDDLSRDLGGPVELGDQEILFQGNSRAAYLRGISAEIYTGRRWESAATEYVPFVSLTAVDDEYPYLPSVSETSGDSRQPAGAWQAPLTLLMMKYGVTDSPFEALRDRLFALRTSSVHYADVVTSTVYLPERVSVIDVAGEFSRDVSLSANAGDVVRTSEPVRRDFSYDVTALSVLLSNSEWMTLYRQSYPGFSVDLLNRYLSFFPPRDAPPETWRLFQNYDVFALLTEYVGQADYAYAACLQLPDTVTPRTRELAGRLTGGQPTTYDKAREIERYLSQTYLYTVLPPELPDDADFVDHFLFEGREGYCTYYATAMVVLCRAAGIPARYVEGFYPGDIEREGYVVVTGKQAHAWPEVFLDGLGWVAFEPTSSQYTGLVRENTFGPSGAEENLPSPLPSTPAAPSPTPSGDTPAPGGNGLRLNFDPAAVLPFVLPALAVLLLLSVQLARRRLFLRRVTNEPFRAEAMTELYEALLSRLRRLGVARDAAETLTEHAARADRELSYELGGASVLPCAAAYSRVRFGGKEPEPGDRKLLLGMLGVLDQALRQRHGKLAFLWRRYVLGQF